MARIIIAEDDIVNQTLIKMIVEELGHSVTVCPDGQDAYDRIMQGDPCDLLITDIMMPNMDGMELISLIRDSIHTKMPILIQSGVMGIKDITHLLEIGATRFQPKPIVKEEMAENIHWCLECSDYTPAS
ncbi:MAG: response regulator [Fibrobacterales bacterium]